MQFTTSSLTPSALEPLPYEPLLKITSHVILAPSITSEDHLASSASDPSADQINSDLLFAPSRPFAYFGNARISISRSSGQRAPPHGLRRYPSNLRYLKSSPPARRYRALQMRRRVGRRAEDVGEEHRCPSQGYTDARNAVKPHDTDCHHIRTSTLPHPWVLPPTKEGCDKSDSPDDSLYPISLHGRLYAADWRPCLKDTEVPGHASCLDGREERASQRCGVCSPSELVPGPYAELGNTPAMWPPIQQWCTSAPSTTVDSRQSSLASDLDMAGTLVPQNTLLPVQCDPPPCSGTSSVSCMTLPRGALDPLPKADSRVAVPSTQCRERQCLLKGRTSKGVPQAASHQKGGRVHLSTFLKIRDYRGR
ncbi:carbohydrate esterase family 9 protein [Paxillus involutus ATCC 200175]|uniref:Carbohydrate esterase family 9 protein n=1 Tax=Paxillus involutus ATCC 200175 TaxID=664439 RepID=A0A0C9SZY5_PAXIN|nr:carbohydrate esterase family 9 protein [Paxillus involutus ATCC 200175]